MIGIEPVSEVVAPGIGDDPARRARFDAWLAESPAIRAGKPLVVLHPYPMFRYKQWRLDGWVEMIGWLREHGFAVALSGGPADSEREYAEQVAAEAGGDVLNLVGRLTFGESAELGAHGSSSGPTPAPRMSRPRPAPTRSRCLARPTPCAGAVAAALAGDRESVAAAWFGAARERMAAAGRAIACRAGTRAASARSTAAATASSISVRSA